MEILKSTPNTLETFKLVAIRSDQLQNFDKLKLVSSRNESRVARSVALSVCEILCERPHFGGRAIMHGSYTRSTSLAKPDLSDIDIVCTIEDDYNGNKLNTIKDFDLIRWGASTSITNHLERNLTTKFPAAKVLVVPKSKGFCIKLQVKTSVLARNWWDVDVIIAGDKLCDSVSQ